MGGERTAAGLCGGVHNAASGSCLSGHPRNRSAEKLVGADAHGRTIPSATQPPARRRKTTHPETGSDPDQKGAWRLQRSRPAIKCPPRVSVSDQTVFWVPGVGLSRHSLIWRAAEQAVREALSVALRGRNVSWVVGTHELAAQHENNAAWKWSRDFIILCSFPAQCEWVTRV
jgi:hypothetical protein